MRRALVLVVGLVLVLAFALPAGAAAWTMKVTGGGQATASGIDFSITVSASDIGGEFRGQMQYDRVGQSVPDLTVHATVECLWINAAGDVAVAAGPARAQYDPAGQVEEGDWMKVEIREGGKGSGDTVRVTLPAGPVACTPSGIFPGLIYDGNFNIRTK